MRRKISILTILVLLLSLPAISQEEIFPDSLQTDFMSATSEEDYMPSLPNLLPPAPNAAALGEFGNTSVGHYTGAANITIPLYEIPFSGESLPLSLDYNTSGIKVAQEATWVGLGWVLNAGGCITRSASDKDDFSPGPTIGYFYDVQLEGLLNDYNQFPLAAGKSNVNPFEVANRHLIDKEPDLFSYNFAGHTGSMFFLKSASNGKPTLKTRSEYLDFTFDFRNNTWTVIDGKGIKYYFGGSDASRDATSFSYMTNTNSGQNAWHPSLNMNKYDLQRHSFNLFKTTTAWYVDSIVAPNGDKIEFRYENEWVTTPLSVSEEIRLRYGIPSGSACTMPDKYYSVNYTYNTMKQSVLKKIVFRNGYIDFTTSQRDDLEGDNFALPANQPDNKALKLDKMAVFNNGKEEIKSFVFDYIYWGDRSDYNTCRLMLDKVTEKKGNEALPPYSFGYYYPPGSFPAKNSPQTDFWGFYNKSVAPEIWNVSATNKADGTFLSSIIIPANLTGDNTPVFLNGRDKSPSAECMRYGTLGSIHYPTGGYSTFTYEPHDFKNTFYTAGTREVLKEKTLLFSFNEKRTPGSMKSTFTIDQYTGPFSFELKDSAWVTISADMENTLQSLISIYFPSGGIHMGELFLVNEAAVQDTIFLLLPDCKLISQSLNLVNRSTSKTLHLPAGKYRLGMNIFIDPQTIRSECVNEYIPGTACNYTDVKHLLYIRMYQMPEKHVTYGGGLRVTQILDADPQTVRKRTFSYKTADGKSSGYLFVTPLMYTAYRQDFLSPPRPGREEELPSKCTSDYLLLRSLPLVETTPRLAASPVGYSVVEEILGSESSTGKTTYHFINKEEVYPGYTYKPVPPAYRYKTSDFTSFFSNTQMVCPGQPAIKWVENGQPSRIQKWDNTGSLVEQTEYTYSLEILSTKECFGLTTFSYYSNQDLYARLAQYGFNAHLQYYLSPCMIAKTYYLQSETSRLYEEKTTSYFNQGKDSFVQSITYEYDNINYKVKQTRTKNSDGSTVRQETVYPTSLATTEAQNMRAKHLMDIPLERSLYMSEAFVQKQRTSYKEFSGKMLPDKIYYKKENNAEESHVTFHQYDKYGNPVYLSRENSGHTVYLWSYKGQYPVAEITHATLQEVKNALGYTDAQINSLADNQQPDVADIGKKLRNYFKNTPSLVTTFSYKPLVGILSRTDSRGVTTWYDYDAMGRLKEVYYYENGDTGKKRVVEDYRYNYR